MPLNNETVGISAEIAIADVFRVDVNDSYRERADQNIVDRIKPCVRSAFIRYNIPRPVLHIAERQNPVDFILYGNETLSVKSNQGLLGKVAPQIIGQPTAYTYFSIMSDELHCDLLAELDGADTYENRVRLFKIISMTRTAEVLNVYWRYLFDCDYLIHFYDVLNEPHYIVFKKHAAPDWNPALFSFSQTLYSWNESCTLYYNGRSIGEFQAHAHRNCLKFRFNMDVLKDFLR